MADQPPDTRSEIERAREEARRAREEAERLRKEARELEHRLRREARERAREERREARGRPPDEPPPGWQGPKLPSENPPEATETVSATLDTAGVRVVAINQPAGHVLVHPGEGPHTVTSSGRSTPKIDVGRAGDRLTIEIQLARGWLFRRRQGARTTVTLPQQLEDVRVAIGYGDIEVRDLESDAFHLDAGAGEVKTFATAGSLEAHAGAGRIVLHAHRGLARCDIGTGDVSMDIAAAVPGEYRGDVGMGRVELRLPPGHEAAIRASSGIGKARIQYPQAGEDAPIKVRIETGIGEATVKERVAGEAPPPPSPARPARNAAARRREAEEMRVLQLLEQGRITSAEAADLIAALHGAGGTFDEE